MYIRVLLSERLGQPRNTHEGIVSALFEKVATVALVPILTANMVSGGLLTLKCWSVSQDQCCKSLYSESVLIIMSICIAFMWFTLICTCM